MTVALTRTPTEARPPRMEPLARLPVFFALAGRRAVVAGGTAPAAWKAELLAAAGAAVEVYAAEPGEELSALAGDPRTAPSSFIAGLASRRPGGAAIAIAACEDDDEAARFAAAARGAGVPVNVIDRPAFCDFPFGAIVNRSPLVIGISTDGAAPVFGQAIRAKLEALIPRGFARWAEAARRWRAELQSSACRSTAAGGSGSISPRCALAASRSARRAGRLRAAARRDRGRRRERGDGLGRSGRRRPGRSRIADATAVRALQSADVILFDDLVSPAFSTSRGARPRTCWSARPATARPASRTKSTRLMVTLAKAGRRVVRLKGGDPMIFGRGDEEIAACRRAGVAVEVVPGITAAQGAAAAQAVADAPRHRAPAAIRHRPRQRRPAARRSRLAGLADPNATTAIYMPVRTFGEFSAQAMLAGLDPATPAAAVCAATLPGESVIHGTVASLPERLASADLHGPVLVLIGRTLADAAIPETADIAAAR